ncbi:hypothetical protein P7K49_009984 [Saguinus oedipus]|uniref:Uncharacterized protein n=1 Tax=Saguinus oedipus TaxID=9490 RepID=A0ABQ9VLJ8_SAGOE|nr:hypothetical protein P7K49_009984 [Saguinus oedipus]
MGMCGGDPQTPYLLSCVMRSAYSSSRSEVNFIPEQNLSISQCIRGIHAATGGWSEQRISMRFMKESEESNRICRGIGTALGPSGVLNRPRSSSQIISLLQVPRVKHEGHPYA